MADRPNPMDLFFWEHDEENKIREFSATWNRINLPDSPPDEVPEERLKPSKEWDELYQKWKKDNNIELSSMTVRHLEELEEYREERREREEQDND